MTIFLRIFLVVMACILKCTIAIAQTPCNEDKGISTNPDAAVNTEKPSKQNGPHNGDNRPVIFDWRRPLFDIRSSLTTSVDINSPFYEPNNAVTNHLYLSFPKDMRPEDGWELIKQEMGAPFDAVNHAYTSDVDYPCLILYNRYTGMLRVFVAVFSVGNFDKVEIAITLTKPPEGGFPSVIDIATSTQQKPLHALDDFVPSPKLSAITRYLNSNRKWMYADFAMIYDPCICAYPSQMQINVNLISEAKVNLSGTTTGTIVNIDQSNSIVPEEKTFSMGLDAASDAYKKGLEVYNIADGLTAATLANVNTYHGYGPFLNQETKDKIERRRELKPAALNELESRLESSDFLKSAFEYAPVISGAIFAAVDMYSFFTGGGKKSPQPQKVEIMPMAISTTSSFNGSITQWSPYREIVFWTPGSNITNLNEIDPNTGEELVKDQYPYYNEPLGLFNLLTTPKADWYFAAKETMNPYWYADTLKIKLHDEIEFTANFAAGFDPNEIEVLGALSVEFDGPIFEGNTAFRSDPSVILESDRIVRTQYVPLGCLSDIPLWFWRIPSPDCNCGLVPSPYIESGRVYLSLVVRLKRNDATANTQGVLFKGKYYVQKEVITQKPATFWQSEWQGIEDELTISNQTITSNLRAWSKITIGENTTIASSNNQPIDIAAGEEINIIGDNIDIGDNTTLRLALPVKCTSTIPPVNQQRLSEFCGSTAYKDTRSFNKTVEENEAVTGLGNTSQTQSDLSIYPMPASSIINIVYNLSKNSTMKVLISDQYGRIVATVVEELSARRNGLLKFDVSNLSSGMYHCILQTDSDYIVKPLSVIH